MQAIENRLELMGNNHQEKSQTRAISESTLQEIRKLFPLKENNDLNEFENKLQENSYYKKMASAFFMLYILCLV